MNFVGIDVRGLDLERWLLIGRAVYVAAFAVWVLRIATGRKTGGAWGPVGLAVLWWGVVTFPLQRVYGLQDPSDRLRNMWWCATAAAGNAPWESGVVGQWSLEPVWSLLVSLLSLRDPARVVVVYPFLPVLGIVAMGFTLAIALRGEPGAPDDEGQGPLRALLAAFFLLLAISAPMDFVGHFRNFWARHFLLKPNHALGMALVPLCIHVLSRPVTWRRALAAAATIGALALMFLADFVLLGGCLAVYAVLLAVRGEREALRGLGRVGVLLTLVTATVVAPYLIYLRRMLPNLVGLAGGGDRPPEEQSLVLMATLDLGIPFALALWSAWRCWRRGRTQDLLWLALLLGALAAWAANALLYPIGRARVSDEIYFFVLFAVAVHAGLGAHDIVHRLAAAPPLAVAPRVVGWRKWTAAGLALWMPFTLPWWWNPSLMDAHFQAALEPLPSDMVALAEGLRRHSRGTDIVLAGEKAASWIPALAGRRVLRVYHDLPGQPGYAREHAILAPGDLAAARARLDELGVRIVVADPSLLREHGLAVADLDRHPLLARLFETSGIVVYAVGPPAARPS